MNILDVPADELIESMARKLREEKIIEPLPWAYFVKTSAGKERPPQRDDWWYIRAASLLRKLYILRLIGVNKLRKQYGSRKNRGMAPERFYPGSGSIIRKILQQLEKAGLVEQKEIKGRKGRTLTKQGKSFLDKTAIEILKRRPRIKEIEKTTEEREIKEEAPKPKTKTKIKKEEKNGAVQTSGSEKKIGKKKKSE